MVVPLPLLLLLLAMGNAAWSSQNSAARQGQPQIMLVTGNIQPTKETHVLSRPALSAAEAEIHHPFFVTFSNPISEEAKERVSSTLGTDLTVYIPQNTFMVWASMRAAREAASIPGVSWVGVVEPKHKIAPGIAALKKQTPQQGEEEEGVELVVTLAPTTAPSAAQLQQMAVPDDGAERKSRRGSVGHDAEEVAGRLTASLGTLSLKTPATARVAGAVRIVVKTTAAEAEWVAAALAQQREVSWIEARSKMVTLGSRSPSPQQPQEQHRDMRNGRVVIKGIDNTAKAARM